MCQFVRQQPLPGRGVRCVLTGGKRHLLPDGERLCGYGPRRFRGSSVGMDSDPAEIAPEPRLEEGPSGTRQRASRRAQPFTDCSISLLVCLLAGIARALHVRAHGRHPDIPGSPHAHHAIGDCVRLTFVRVVWRPDRERRFGLTAWTRPAARTRRCTLNERARRVFRHMRPLNGQHRRTTARRVFRMSQFQSNVLNRFAVTSASSASSSSSSASPRRSAWVRPFPLYS
jgi:hypothetical protein